MVQYADVLPTLFEVAGGDAKNHAVRRHEFFATLKDPAKPHRKYAYALHNNVPEGPPYPIRSITDGEYRYIRNLTPDEIYIEKHLMGLKGQGTLNNPYWGTWIFHTDQPRTLNLVKRYVKRPAEQLYHTKSDPQEMTNLAGDLKHAQIQAQLSGELDRWLKSQGDPGIPLDTDKALQAARKGQHAY